MFKKKKLYNFKYTGPDIYCTSPYCEVIPATNKPKAVKKFRKLATRNHGYAAIRIIDIVEIS